MLWREKPEFCAIIYALTYSLKCSTRRRNLQSLNTGIAGGLGTNGYNTKYMCNS